MMDEYDIEQLYTTEEKTELNKLAEMSRVLNGIIKEKRKLALDIFLSDNTGLEIKRELLKNYFNFRMNFSDCKVDDGDAPAFSLDDLYFLAKRLHKEFKIDHPLVLDSLAFFESSLTRDDIILATHNFRLSRDPVSLAQLVSIIGYIVQYLFLVDGADNTIVVSNNPQNYEESIIYLNRILAYVDSYVQDCCNNLDSYKKKYSLSEDIIYPSFSDKIDILAGRFFSKQTAQELHANTIVNIVKSELSFSNQFYESVFESLINELYDNQSKQKEDIRRVPF